MNIGLFGGSFNPPHVAHLIVAETVREQFALDEVWWMPAHIPPHKTEATVAPAAHRLEMTRRATAANPAFRVRTDEIERGGTSYTVETLRALEANHPDARFHLLLGSDSLAGFPSWREPEEIVRRVTLLVYPRPGEEPPPADLPARFDPRVQHADAPLLDISGTALRARRRRGRSLRYLVPDAVRAYIDEHALYDAAAPVSE